MCIHNACMHVYVHTCVCTLESDEDSVALILDKACRYFSILTGIMRIGPLDINEIPMI